MRKPGTGQTGMLGRRRQPPREKAIPAKDLPQEQAPSHLLLQIGRTPETVWVIGCKVHDIIVIGRSDVTINFQADVDLTPFQPEHSTISRRHIEILRQDDRLLIRDPGSRNGTSLNDKTLEVGALYPIRDGDVVEAGNVKLIIWFVDAS